VIRARVFEFRGLFDADLPTGEALTRLGRERKRLENETANGFGFVFTYMRERRRERRERDTMRVEEKGGSVVEAVIVCHFIILPLLSLFVIFFL